ncbi:MAG TPA: cysteine ABC transporter permease [Lachnospiraceae bacterium]|nr:cysteine ABC transporter permease [Lachnospiraceae bacterium]
MVQAFEWKYVIKAMPRLLHFIPITLEIWAAIIASSVLVGTLFAVIRTKHIPVLEQLVRVIISVVRGIPPLTQLFIFYFGLPALLLKVGVDITRIDGMWFVIMAYGLSNGAVISESLRAAFASVGKGQEDAGYSIGMSGTKVFLRIMIPQALVVALPSFGNLCVAALKNTSLAFAVGVIELMTTANQFGTYSLHRMESYVAVAIVYYALYLVIRFVFNRIENRVAYQKD